MTPADTRLHEPVEWAGLTWVWVDDEMYDMLTLPSFRDTRSALMDFGDAHGEPQPPRLFEYWPKFMVDYVLAPADHLVANVLQDGAYLWFRPRTGLTGYDLIRILLLIDDHRKAAKDWIDARYWVRCLREKNRRLPAHVAENAFWRMRRIKEIEDKLAAYAIRPYKKERRQRITLMRAELRTLGFTERKTREASRRAAEREMEKIRAWRLR